MKILISNTREENYGYFSSYNNRENQPQSHKENMVDLTCNPSEKVLQEPPLHTAGQSCVLCTDPWYFRMYMKTLALGSVATSCPDFVPNAPQKRHGEAWFLLLTPSDRSPQFCFTFPIYKIRITNTPLTTSSCFDGGWYHHSHNTTVAGY